MTAISSLSPEARCNDRVENAAGGASTLQFVSHLPAVLAELAASAQQHNWQLLGRLAHQLKEAVEVSGLDDLSPYAARLERAAVDSRSQLDIRVALEDLVSECRKMRA